MTYNLSDAQLADAVYKFNVPLGWELSEKFESPEDLNGDGQLSTAAEGTGARFDFDANGFAESAGWVAPADGLVVRDLNGNGTIDSGRELFGDQTQLPNGSFAANGFQAMAVLASFSAFPLPCSATS